MFAWNNIQQLLAELSTLKPTVPLACSSALWPPLFHPQGHWGLHLWLPLFHQQGHWGLSSHLCAANNCRLAVLMFRLICDNDFRHDDRSVLSTCGHVLFIVSWSMLNLIRLPLSRTSDNFLQHPSTTAVSSAGSLGAAPLTTAVSSARSLGSVFLLRVKFCMFCSIFSKDWLVGICNLMTKNKNVM